MSRPSSSLINPAIACIALILSFFLWWAGSFDTFNEFLYDQGLRYKVANNPRPLNPHILKIDLNDSSEAAFGESLDTREPFGAVLSILGDYGAAAGLDFIFPRSKPGDQSMIRAAGNFNNLVYAVIPVMEGKDAFAPPIDQANKKILRDHLWHIKGNTEKLPEAVSFLMSNPEISASAVMLGHISVYPEKDGVYRRAALLCRWEDGVIPSLPLALAVSELGIDPAEIEFVPGRGLVLPMDAAGAEKPLVIPCDANGYLLIPYGASWETDLYRYSFADLIAADDPSGQSDVDLFSELYGAIAIVADITTGKRDFGITPFESAFPLSGIHAAVLSGILDEAFYIENNNAVKTALLIILFLPVFFLCLLKKDLFFHIGHALLFLCFCFFTFALWNWGNRLPWFGVGAFLLLASWAMGFLFRLFNRYREQLLYKSALSRYFPSALAQRIAAEGKTELKPAFKELTMLFADIAGFTRWSSDKEPAMVHEFLTDYLESMATILFENGGTVDKFMGDGILAFFGDPFEQPDHAQRCVGAAIQMQKKARELNAKWRHIGIDFKIRIGVNSGKVIVGNLGTKTRIEYTVIGSAVNLAQRMESNAPQGGILAAEPAWLLTRDHFPFGEKRDVAVKGYDEPIYAYEVVLNLD